MNHAFRLHNLARHLVDGKLARWFIFYIFLSTTQSCTPSVGGQLALWFITFNTASCMQRICFNEVLTIRPNSIEIIH